MQNKKIRDIPGIGSTLEQILNGLGVQTCQNVVSRLPHLFINFNSNFFEYIIRASLGQGKVPVDKCKSETG